MSPPADPYGMEVEERASYWDYVPPAFRRGGEFWRWVSMIGLNLLTVLGLAALVIGTGLVGAGLAVLASGFNLVDVGLTEGLGSSLAVGLVVALLGAFATGLAVEGPIGYKVRRFDARSWEAALTMIPGYPIARFVAERLADLADAFLLDYDPAFRVVPEVITAVAESALWWPLLVGVAVTYLVHEFLVARFPQFEYQAHGVVYVIWLLAAMEAFALF